MSDLEYDLLIRTESDNFVFTLMDKRTIPYSIILKSIMSFSEMVGIFPEFHKYCKDKPMPTLKGLKVNANSSTDSYPQVS